MKEDLTEVSIGILKYHELFLVSVRPANTSFSGFYEFPGGKIEPGESAYDALCREFKEEVGITIKKARYFMDQYQALPMRPLHLIFWIIEDFEGQAVPQEGQMLHWLDPAQLENVNFLPANQLVIQALLRELVYKPH